MPTETMPAWERRFRAPTPTFPTWSPHAPGRLVYVSNESGSYQVYAWDRSSGESRRVSDNPIGVPDAMPSSDGRRAIWFDDDSGDESGRWMAAPFDGGAAEPLLPNLAVGWPSGLATGRNVVAVGRADRDGFAIHASVDGEPARELFRSAESATVGGHVLRGGFNLGGLSGDETLLCVEHAEQGDEVRRALRVLDVRSREVVGDLWDGPGFGLSAQAWSPVPGDQRLAVRHEREDRERPALWDLATGERRDLLVDLAGEVIPLDWWPDASALLVAHFFEGRHELFRLELAGGSLERLAHPQGTVSDARVRPDGDVWLQISSGGTAPRVVSVREGEVLAGAERAPDGALFQSWHFTNAAGDRVHGFIAAPRGKGPFPVIMHVHGGPTSLDADEWHPYIQAYVDHGFVVGTVNYRGSAGYGRSWRDSIIGDIGFPEEEDVIAGLRDLVGRGIADPERAVIGGWSWGGYITLLSIGRRPDMWRAAIGGIPVGDYAAGYDELSPELQAYDRYLLGGRSPHEVPELMAERSPIVYASKVRTPTIVLVGRNDTRCPYGQAMAWVEAVRAGGGEVHVYEYGSGHSSYDVDEVVRQVAAILAFLDRHVDGSA